MANIEAEDNRWFDPNAVRELESIPVDRTPPRTHGLLIVLGLVCSFWVATLVALVYFIKAKSSWNVDDTMAMSEARESARKSRSALRVGFIINVVIWGSVLLLTLGQKFNSLADEGFRNGTIFIVFIVVGALFGLVVLARRRRFTGLIAGGIAIVLAVAAVLIYKSTGHWIR
ncbi:MAG: CD225/dispanin family protein [Propionibacteriaceae bacterium]|jgi:hypothetical protein|nr:CD225/dispanin family protein [Propionibacteriaceae bacterium]